MNQGDLHRIYHIAFNKLLKRLERLPAQDQDALMDQLEAELRHTIRILDMGAADFVEQVLPVFYEQAEKAVVEILGGGHMGSSLNRRELQLLAENTADQLTEVNHLFGRRTMDTVRKIDMDVVSESLVGARDMPREIKRKLIQELEKAGMQFVPASDGRQMDLRNYAEMVGRTTPREAANLGTVETIKQLGYDLVKCTETHTCCAVCGAVMGRILSISGEDKRFPALSEVQGFAQGFHTIHPNCKHNFVPVVWDLLTPEEQAAALKRSKQPLNQDSRTAKQIAAYNEDQAKKRQLWQDRRQWEKLKILLPEHAPQKLSAYRNMKQANSLKYRQLMDLRKINLLKNKGIQQAHIKTFDDVLPMPLSLKPFGVNAFAPRQTVIGQCKIFAAEGMKREFRDAALRAQKFGGKPETWMKKQGIIESDRYIIDVHWEESTEYGRVNWKIKSITEKGGR